MIVTLVFGCGGSGGPTAPGSVSSPASASFEVSGAGYDGYLNWVDGPNLVFCRQNGSTPATWVRMAADQAANGETSLHIDLDICELAGGGTYGPKEALGGVCAGRKTWGIWFHDGPGAYFTNLTTSEPCELTVDENGTRYTGSFSCRGLVESGGGRSVDILAGSFSCNLH